MLKISDYVIDFFSKKGIKHVFMISGGGAMHLVDSVGTHPDITYICPHHEQAAAIAAEGYYRAIGKLSLVVVTTGPGGTNTITGVLGEWLDSIPAIFISGQVKNETTIASVPNLKLRQLGDQEINIVDIVRPITKFAVMVTDPKLIRYYIEKSYYLANNGRPGPVWLDIPLDVQASKIDPEKLKRYNPIEDKIFFDVPQIKVQIKDIIKHLSNSKRPVILAGHGIRLSGAVELFKELIEKLNIPVLTAICGHDLIYSDHPLYYGRPGIVGDRIGNFVIQNSDLMITIGARMGIRQISYNYSSFAREAFKIMVDVDGAELNKPTLHLDMKILSDAKLFIKEFLNQMSEIQIPPKKEWLEWCKSIKFNLPSIYDDNVSNPKYVNSYRFSDILFRLLKEDDLVVTGNGTAYTGTYQIMHINKGVRVFTNQGCASMGYDIPATIGACIARNKKSTILITGDGSIQMNIQELQTIITHQLPIKIFVLNNAGYLSIRGTQDSYFNSRYIASCPDGKVVFPDICKIALAYGIPSMRIENEINLKEKLQDILLKNEPFVCDIIMDPKQTLLPKTSSEVKPDGKLISKPLEDMFPFIERELFKKIMISKPLNE